MSHDTEEARQEVQAARARLRSTVGELGTAVHETRVEVTTSVKKSARFAAVAGGAIVALGLLRRLRR